jgi:putative oxidoreductase
MDTSAAISKSSPRRGALPRTLLVLGRIALGFIFIYAAYTKFHFGGRWHLGDYQFFFAIAIDSYKMLPMWAVEWTGRVLPWFELALGALLVSGAGLRWTGLISSGLLLVFIGAITRAAILGLEINCGCFGNNEKLGTATMVRDTSMLILALAVTVGAFLIKKRKITISS